jgi:hypothetical protein
MTDATKKTELEDGPIPERWLIGRVEVDGHKYDRSIFVTFATVEEYRAALRQVDGWFNA